MVDGTGLVVLIAGGFILIRPRDVPGICRNLGRAVGFTVRGIKKARDAADEAIQNSSASSNPTYTSLRTAFQSSISHFSDLTSTVRRDMTDVPLTPAQYIRSRMRKAALQEKNNAMAQKTSPYVSPSGSSGGTTPYTSAQPIIRSSDFNSKLDSLGRASSGSDFIARGIEEAALHQQQQNLFQQERNSHSTH